MKDLTLANHTFSTISLHPEALHLMEFIVENLEELNMNSRTVGFDDKHLGVMADVLGNYAALQRFLQVKTGGGS